MISAAEMDPEFDQMMLAQQEYDQAIHEDSLSQTLKEDAKKKEVAKKAAA